MKIYKTTLKKIIILTCIFISSLSFLSCEKNDNDYPLVGIWENYQISSNDLYSIEKSKRITLEYDANGNFSLKTEYIETVPYHGETITRSDIIIFSGTYYTENNIVTETRQKKVEIVDGEIIYEIEYDNTIEITSDPLIAEYKFIIENNKLTRELIDSTLNPNSSVIIFERK